MPDSETGRRAKSLGRAMISEGAAFFLKWRFPLEIFALIFSFNSAYGRFLWPRYAARTSAFAGLRRRCPSRSRPRSPRAALLAQIHHLDRPQGHRHPVRDHRPDLSFLRVFPDDVDAV